MGKLRPGAGPLEQIGSGLANRDPAQVGAGLINTGQGSTGPAMKKSNMPNGPWLPHVAEAIRIIAGTFGVSPSTYPNHGVQPGGQATAVDFVHGSWGRAATGAEKAKGDAIIAFVDANWQALNINYTIWQDQIKGPQTGGARKPYPTAWKAGYGNGDTTSPSAAHTDHSHVSFNQSGAMPDMAKLKPPGSLGAEAANLGNAAGGALEWMQNIPEWIAQGFANALLRFIKAVYGYTILRPLDFAGGFWWELTKRASGYADKAKEGKVDDPDVFSEDNRNRLWTLGFLFATYYLAFGRDRTTGQNNLDKLIGSGADLVNRDVQGSKNYNDIARVTATVKGVTVARRKARHTTRRGMAMQPARKVGVSVNGTAKRRASGTPKRDTNTGRFTGKRTTETAEKEGRRGEVKRTTQDDRADDPTE